MHRKVCNQGHDRYGYVYLSHTLWFSDLTTTKSELKNKAINLSSFKLIGRCAGPHPGHNEAD